MANLAEAIQGLVQHMRTEQQMIRDWAEAPVRAEEGNPRCWSVSRDSPETNLTRIADGARGRRRASAGFDYWPGFVDALSTLLLAIIFLLSVFVVAQFFLSQEITGKDKALERLNAQIAAAQRSAVAGEARQGSISTISSRRCARARRRRSRARPRQGSV
jgi:hypothetical protein